MKENESKNDRIIRVVLGVVLLYLYFGTGVSGLLGALALIIGAIALITGAVGFCPLYALLKTSTKK